MSKILLRSYENGDYSQVVNLIIDAFKSKFLINQNLSQQAITQMMNEVWNIKESDHVIHTVATDEKNRVVGVILVRLNHKKTVKSNFPIFSFIKRFGFKNTFIFLIKLLILEQTHFKDSYIEHIAVNNKMRGQGIGKLLLENTLEKLNSLNFMSCTLAVAANNPAKTLYETMGFKKICNEKSRVKGKLIGYDSWDLMEASLKQE